MVDAIPKREPGQTRLGRGLAALIGEISSDEDDEIEVTQNQSRLPVEFLVPNRNNPRKVFAPEDLQELAFSIKERGVFQPIIVRPDPQGGEGCFEIIAGERRWRAAQMAGLHEVPVLIHSVSDKEALEIAIIENVQRTDLNSIEEALGYEQLAREHGYSQSELANVIGKSRSHIANTIRLLKLPDVVKTYISEGKLTAGHARSLITVENPEELAKQIVEEGLTVRHAEALNSQSKEQKKTKHNPVVNDPDTLALEKELTDHLGLKVKLKLTKNGERGHLAVSFRSFEQLDSLVSLLKT